MSMRASRKRHDVNVQLAILQPPSILPGDHGSDVSVVVGVGVVGIVLGRRVRASVGFLEETWANIGFSTANGFAAPFSSEPVQVPSRRRHPNPRRPRQSASWPRRGIRCLQTPGFIHLLPGQRATRTPPDHRVVMKSLLGSYSDDDDGCRIWGLRVLPFQSSHCDRDGRHGKDPSRLDPHSLGTNKARRTWAMSFHTSGQPE